MHYDKGKKKILVKICLINVFLDKVFFIFIENKKKERFMQFFMSMFLSLKEKIKELKVMT